LSVRQDEKGVGIAIPHELQEQRPCEHAWAFRIPVETKALTVQER
jgi:hypothetical protein